MKNLKQTAKKWTVLSIVLSLLLAAGLVSCASSDDDDETKTETVTVTLVPGEGASGTSGAKTIEKGKTIADISGYTAPTKDGYSFSGWYDSNKKSYTTSTKITSDVTLYASWDKDEVVTENEDGTTTTTKETQNADGSTTTTAETKDAEGNTTETKTITIASDGTKVTETKTSEKTVTETVNTDGSSVTETTTSDGTTTTETVNADKSSSTTTKSTDENGTTTTTTVEKDASGATTKTTTVTESTDSDGTTTTTTVEKDGNGIVTQKTEVTETSDGKVTTTVTDANGKTTTTETQKDYKKYIDAGIKALEEETPDVESAISNFNQAYSTEPNDETRLYSALASLASISTTSKTADFFKNHLGITNYPSTMNALLDDEWLEAQDYIDYTDENEYVDGYSGFTAVTDSSSSSGYYARYYCCKITPADSYDSSSNTVYKGNIYKETTISSKTFYANLYSLAEYEKNTNGTTLYPSYYYTYTLANDGDCYVRIYSSSSDATELSSRKVFEPSDWTRVSYSFDVHTKFAKLNVPSWFANSSLNNTLGALLLANIVEGNTNGLNSALDDFYSLIFDSDEYKDAISKIDAITSSVKVPANVIEDFGLTDIVGGTSVKLGAPELKLVKTAFTALKATIEYFQSYNLNSDLSFLEFDWSDNDAIQKKFENYYKYDSSIDPLANGFLSQRNKDKMTSSKSDFAEAVGELITAYNDILSNKGDYPTALTDNLGEYEILKSGAEQLQDAISNGGKFYIPDAETEDELKELSSWPTSGDKYVDLGALFDNDTFALKNIIRTSDGKPNIYNIIGYDYEYGPTIRLRYYDDENNTSKSVTLPSSNLCSSTTDDDGKTGIQIYLEACKTAGYQNFEENRCSLGLQVSYYKSFETVLVGFDLSEFIDGLRTVSKKQEDGTRVELGHVQYVPLGIIPGLYIYNFYHDGAITDDLKEIISSVENEDDDEEYAQAVSASGAN